MLLACNYYPETERLVTTGTIDIDYYKFPSLGFQMDILNENNRQAFETFAGRLRETKPILLHGLYPPPHDLSSADFIDRFDAANAEHMIDITGTPGLSFHPCIGPIDRDRPIREIIRTISENLNFLVTSYHHMSFVSVENLDHPKHYGPLLDAAAITEIVNSSGASLLLDISHAYCASFFRGEDFFDYLHRLPLARVSEIHLNGWTVSDGDVMCHLKIHPKGYELLQYLLDYCKPGIVTVEYGRNNDRLGIGCPLVTPGVYSDAVAAEITEQIEQIRMLL